MRKFVVALLVLFAFTWVSALQAPARAQVDAQARLIHLPVTSAFAQEAIEIAVKLEGTTERVVEARVYFRRPEEQGYRYVEMREDVDQWVGLIPAAEVVAPRLQYFVTVVVGTELVLTYPDYNPYYEPLEVVITERPPQEKAKPGRGYSSLELMVLSPEPDSRLGEQEVVVAFSLKGDPAEIDSATYRLMVDGKDVTRNAEVSAAVVTLVPKRLSPGRHTAELTARDRAGKPLRPASVNFVVVAGAKGTRESNFTGRVYADARYEDVTNIAEETYQVGGTLAGQYGALRYGANVFTTSRERSDAQPRNRYSARLELPWIGVHLGDVNPRFNDLVLWGKRVRGLYGYLHTGVINLDLVYGETYRAVEGLGDSLGIRRFGTYRQMLYGVRPSIGKPNRFLLALNFLKVKDDTSSILWGPSPRDNVVVGPDLFVALDRRRIELQAAAALSMTTMNTSTGAFSKAKIDSVFDTEIPIDPKQLEKLLIINDSTTPLDPRHLSSLAYTVTLRLNYFGNLIRVGYKSIGSEFYSLGNTFLRRDIRGWYASDRVRLFRNQLFCTVGLEHYQDNFSQDDGQPALDLTTTNLGLSFFPGRGLPRLTVDYRRRLRDNGVDSLYTTPVDTFATGENSLTSDYMVQLAHDFALFDLQHTLSFNWISSNRSDRLSSSQAIGSTAGELNTALRMLSLRTRFAVPLVTTVNYAWNENRALGGSNQFSFKMLDLGAEYKLLGEALTVHAGIRRIAAHGLVGSDGTIKYNKNSYLLGAVFRPLSSWFMYADLSYINFIDRGFNADGSARPSYDDLWARVRVEKRF
ncbi:MAG: hypothetical protein ONB17_03575 [candidate division KSB1 bacterium]|nr:hypothetical protein [candidate division KSB1 bacterium]MDZ7393943.1 hypothetical protein [candidate division KSB1 bacterium]